MLYGAGWWLVTEISEKPLVPILWVQTIREEFFLGCLTLEDGTENLSRKKFFIESLTSEGVKGRLFRTVRGKISRYAT
jgi:hypothetical protein